MTKIERGVMIMKDGKAWGETYADGHCTCYGWMNPANPKVRLRNPEYCKKPTDATYDGSHDEKELAKGEVVMVERKTEVTIL